MLPLLLLVGTSFGGCLRPPGLAQPFAALGVPAVKSFPELISWEKMQPAGGSSIDFRPSDRFVRECQAAGFTELVLTLKSRSRWASKDYLTNYRPKDKYLDLYEAWVGGVVERYDADGLKDMGLATGPDGTESGLAQIKVENGVVQVPVTPVPVYVRGGS